MARDGQNMNIFKEAVIIIILSTLSLSASQFLHACRYFKSPLHLEANGDETIIEIPNNGEANYRPNQWCEWVLYTDREDYVIRFTVKYRMIEGEDVRGDCVADYLDIFDVIDGANVFKARVCSYGRDQLSFQSSQSSMVVKFISNNHHEYQGFQATYDIYKKEQDNDAKILGLSLGISAGVLLVIAIICIALNIHFRRKKLLERTQGLVNHPVNVGTERLSQRATSPTFASVSSPFVHTDRDAIQQSIIFSGPFEARPPTPPPAYDAIDGGSHFDNIEAPPPYESVVKEMANNSSTDHSNSYV